MCEPKTIPGHQSPYVDQVLDVIIVHMGEDHPIMILDSETKNPITGVVSCHLMIKENLKTIAKVTRLRSHVDAEEKMMEDFFRDAFTSKMATEKELLADCSSLDDVEDIIDAQ